MLIEYSEGFRLGISLTWRPSSDVVLRIGELAQCLANEFQSEVLFEAEDSISDTGQERWLLATPGQKELRAVRIEALTDGVSLRNEQ